MQYELYADSLFLVNFVMNLYLLLLVNHSTLRTATPARLLLGAAVGGMCGLLPFVIPGPGAVKIAFGAVPGTLGMLLIAFPVRSFRMFLKLLEKLFLYSFCMGGALLFLIRTLPFLRSFLTGICGIMGAGGVLFLFLSRFRPGYGGRSSLCRAVLRCGESRLEVAALVDSGNSLVEPISGKPVCIVEAQVLESFRGKLAPGCRAIPYHSIGKRHGILEGYLLPELSVDLDGVIRTFREVYIAASSEGISKDRDLSAESVKMIINPMLFAESNKGKPRGRQNVRIYDTESSGTG